MSQPLSSVLWPASIRWFDLTLPTPAENLALDEALLSEVDANPSRAVLRVWESNTYCVVLGRSNHVETEVDESQCRKEGIPILRRSSGGGTVVIGPGCLAFAMALPLTDSHRTLGVATITLALMERVASGLRAAIPSITVCGTSDLAIDGRKFSGNSERWLRHGFLHHGTILYDFDLPRIARLLKMPARVPEYRSGREHNDFLTNIALSRTRLVEIVVEAWNATLSCCDARTLGHAAELTRTRYCRDEWNLSR